MGKKNKRGSNCWIVGGEEGGDRKYVGGNGNGECVDYNGNGEGVENKKLKRNGVEVRKNKAGSIDKRLLSNADGLKGNMLARPEYKILEEIRAGIMSAKEFLDQGIRELRQRCMELKGQVSADRAFRTFETRYVEIMDNNLQNSGCDLEFYLRALDRLYENDVGLKERKKELHDIKFAEESKVDEEEEDSSYRRGVTHWDSPPQFFSPDLGIKYVPDERVM